MFDIHLCFSVRSKLVFSEPLVEVPVVIKLLNVTQDLKIFAYSQNLLERIIIF